MKIGGYVRYQVNTGIGSITSGPFSGGNAFYNRVNASDVAQRVRAVATFDTRQQTAYGTLRTYLLMGYTQDTNAGAGLSAVPGANTPVYMTRAFIQIAGFTFGKATSFFDFVSTAAVAYNAGYLAAPDTGDGGQIVGAYTAQFGNGLSASLAIEQSRRNNTIYTPGLTAGNLFSAAFGADNLSPAIANASNLPDIVGNIRVDQAWGSAQISAALHDASAGYYGIGPSGGATGAASLVESQGHPDNKWGWAVSAGLRLNAPMFGPGDFFQGAVVYSEGAIRYASVTPASGGIQQYWSGNTWAFGQYTDAMFGGTATAPGAFGNDLNLTTAWSAMASYEHFWTPSLKTSIYGSYIDVSYNGNATGLFCAAAAASVAGAGGTGCSPDFSIWNIGSRSQWNITKDLYVGIDVIYSKFNTASIGNGPILLTTAQIGATSGKGAGFYSTADQDQVSATWRIHRDIVP